MRLAKGTPRFEKRTPELRLKLEGWRSRLVFFLAAAGFAALAGRAFYLQGMNHGFLQAKGNFVLLALVIACALGVITAQHEARKRFIALEAEQDSARKLEEEWTQLQLEQSTWATHKRVESIALRQLGMKTPDAASTVVVPLEAR